MCYILRKFVINSLYICPPHLYTVATLVCEIQKSYFTTELFIHTSDYLCYESNYFLRRKQTVTPWKMSPHYLVKCSNFNYLTEGMLHSSKRWWLWKRSSCDVWKIECQPSNVTANVQSDHLLHGHMLPVFFCHWSTVSSTTLCWNSAHVAKDASASCPNRGLVLNTRKKNKKKKKLCILQGSVVTFFRCGG